MLGEVVDEVDGHLFRGGAAGPQGATGARQDVELTADDLRELIAQFQEIYELEVGSPFPQEAPEQLRRAIRARYSTRGGPARTRLQAHLRHPDVIGTAVNVVQMVFGNKGDTSGTGVCFSARPLDG